MTGAGGDGLPVDFGAEAVEGGRDLDGLGPGEPVVVAAGVEGAHVFNAVNKMHGAVAGGDQHGVVDRLLVRAAHVLFLFVVRHVRIAREARTHVRDLLLRAERAAAVGAATQMDLDLAAISRGEFPRFGVGEHRALGGDDDAGNAVGDEARLLFLEDIDRLEQRRAECDGPRQCEE